MIQKILALLGCGIILISTYLYIWKVSLMELEFGLNHGVKARAVGLCIGAFILGTMLTAELSYKLLGYVLILDSFLVIGNGFLRRDIFDSSARHRPLIVIFSLIAFVFGTVVLLI